MTFDGARDQIPVLCKNCGGPMEPREAFAFVCPYCDSRDRLPEDELDRALELKRRIARVKSREVQIDRAQMALARIFEDRKAFFRVQGTWLFVFVVVVAYSVLGSWSVIANAPPGFGVGLAIHALVGPMFVGGIAVAFAVALWIGRAGYRRSVRPLLTARPPRQPGEPVRCRTCGAGLPDERGPLIQCRYCDTHNLVTAEIQEDRTRLLSEEEDDYRRRASGAVAQTARRAVHMTRTLVVSIVVVYALVFGLMYLASMTFPTS
jgi:DNA-directed RNA polymerase subunit RPC12/RpoP